MDGVARLRQVGPDDLHDVVGRSAPPGRAAPGRARRHPRPADRPGCWSWPWAGPPGCCRSAHRAQALPGRGRLPGRDRHPERGRHGGRHPPRRRRGRGPPSGGRAGRLPRPPGAGPPMVSAIKVAGERLYAKARRGAQEVERAPRPIVVHELRLLGFTPEAAQARISVVCSGGTCPVPGRRPRSGPRHPGPPGQPAAHGRRPVHRGREGPPAGLAEARAAGGGRARPGGRRWPRP